MEIVFVTNYYNHHQSALAECFHNQSGCQFHFVETEQMPMERKKLGWSNDGVPAYVKRAYASKQDRTECQKIINDADVVIWGSCPFKMIKPRLKARKMTFCYSERLFKKGFGPISFGGRAVKYWLKHKRYQKNHYLLCASAYAAEDYARLGLFKNRAYKWGYLPEGREIRSLEEIIAHKRVGTLLWVGRMIDWKHPEIPVQIAKRLKDEGIRFQLDMIGVGEELPMLRSSIDELDLSDCVYLHGAKSPDEVRRYMEMADIYLFTSDQNEGWGAVVNEAMSSACAVVACDAAGSVRYLIDKGNNGMIFHCGQMNELYDRVNELLNDRELCHRYGRQAYATMKDEWSANNAAKRFVELVQALRNGQECAFLQGPCSKA